MIEEMPENYIGFSLSSLPFRTLIIPGEYDTWVSEASIEQLKKQLSEQIYWILPDSGHLPLEEQPAVFNEILISFLNQAGR